MNFPSDANVQVPVLEFLLQETRLLDSYQFQQWASLLTDDFTYKIPVPSTPADLSRPSWDENVLIVDENKDSLINLWFKRFDPHVFGHAWGENPRQRVRRFVSNTIISPGEESDTFVATSNVLLAFARQSDPVVLVSAGRIDLVRRVDGALKLARRVVHLDQTVLSVAHLRLVF